MREFLNALLQEPKMQIHADLQQEALVEHSSLEWVDSPQPGVQRKMLERDGEEVARATSLVKYDSNSYFPEHTHAAGEEFIVIDGTFSDESSDFPEGSYVRNPHGSSHKPFTKNGCEIFVKLRQIHENDSSYTRVNFAKQDCVKVNENLEYMELHKFGSEEVILLSTHEKELNWNIDLKDGIEIFILQGEILYDGLSYSQYDWLRFPPNKAPTLTISENSSIWLKTGHLPAVTEIQSNIDWQSLLKGI